MPAQLRNCLPEIKRLREVINKAAPGSPASQLSANAEKLGRSASDLLVKEVLDSCAVVLDQPLRTPA